MAFHKMLGDCRIYSVYNASGAVASPGYHFYRDCQGHTSCQAIMQQGWTTSGVYTLDLMDGGSPLKVYCDMTSDGGGWTVFQRRQDGSVNFYLYWADYKNGFGSVTGEHWLGNEALHRLTASGPRQLRVELKDWGNQTVYARYSSFRVGNEASSYTLAVSGYSGTAGDSLASHDGMKFTTRDRDNDVNPPMNCASKWSAAWWFWNCFDSSLNGLFGQPGDVGWQYIVWWTWRSREEALAFSEMKLR